MLHNSGRAGAHLNAQVGGGTVEQVAGLFGQAAKLTNNGYFRMPDGAIEGLTNFSLSVWVYIHEQTSNQTVCTFAQGTDRYLILTTQRGNAENGVSLVMTNHNRSDHHVGKEERIAYAAQKEKLTANAWHHLAFTLEGNTGTLYVDGIRAEVKTDFTTNPSCLGHTTDNYIGRPTWNDPYLNGLIDDFRIYDYALTREQVFSLSSMADATLAEADKHSLTLGDISAVATDMDLPRRGESGSEIEWHSSNTNLMDHEGRVFRPDAGSGHKTVTLKATIGKGRARSTKKFAVTVKDAGLPPHDLDVFSMQTGNPTVPAYLADASFYYDKVTDMFYAYGTNDGAGGGNVYPTQVWYSKDCKVWKNAIVNLPKSWTDYAGTVAVWAPSIEYHPLTRKYYLMYGIDTHTFIAMADHPLGPWEDANGAAPGKMFYRGYDGQFFIDDDHTMYIVTDAGHFKIMKMRFDPKGKMYFDNTDPQYDKSGSNPFVGTYNYKQITEIRNTFEASLIYKRNGLYYLMWSFNGSENYNVRYAVAEQITGPYREINESMTRPILVRNDQNRVLGPGHHSMFNYRGRTFIAYHRQHYPFVDSKRQTCIDEVFFNPDGSILPIPPTHRGVTVAPDVVKETRTNVALGKQTLASSARSYDSSHGARRYRTYDIAFRYDSHFAVDENHGTRWDAGLGAENPWLVVDLYDECRVDEVETCFEFTSRTYKYTLEYLSGRDADDLPTASQSKSWKLFAHRSLQGAPLSPVSDRPAHGAPVSARFVKLTIHSAENLPASADEWGDKTNADNALSIFELKVYGAASTDDVGRTLEAELFRNQSGTRLVPHPSQGYCVGEARNNSHLLYENINLSKGATTFTARVAGMQGGLLEVHLNSLSGKPAGTLRVAPSDGTTWLVETVPLNQAVQHLCPRVYLVFKGDAGKTDLLRLDWFRFE